MKKIIALMLCVLLAAVSPIALADALPSISSETSADATADTSNATGALPGTLPSISSVGGAAPAAAPATATVDMQTITSYSGMYTLGLPADYMPVTAETLDAIMSVINVEVLTLSGMDEASAQTLVDTITSIDYESVDFVFTPDMAGNINGLVTLGVGMTNELMAANVELLDAELIKQYGQLGVAEEDCVPLGMLTFGDSDIPWYGFQVSFLNQSMHQFITCTDAGDQITLTLNTIPEDDIALIMESFAFVTAK